MSQLDTVKNDAQADQIYFDLTVSNFQSNLVAPIPFVFNETRTLPFVGNPQNYYLSILRFSIDSGTLPVFIPSIQPNSADPNLTIYSVSLSWLDAASGITYNFQKFVDWIPQDASLPVPPAPAACFNGLQQNDSGYYNCYSFTWMSYVIYVAIQQCVAGLEAAILAGGVVDYPDLQHAPPFVWDTTSNRAVLYADALVYDLNSAFLDYDPVNIYFNAPLFGLFNTFPARYLGYGTPFGKDFRILIVDVGGTNISPLIPAQAAPIPPAVYTSYLAIACFQEQSTCANITPIQGIVFCTNTIPVEANQVSTPVVLSNNQQLTLVGNNSATANILTDLISDSGIYSPNLSYVPSAEYRLLTLYGNAPLSTIDITVFYRLRNGSLVPFRLQSGGTLTLKLGFISKKSRHKS